MEMVRLGRTGAQVSVVGLGCGGHSRLGMAQGGDADHAASVVRRALDLGITLIDTARAYGTEEAVGMGVEGRRHDVFLSTKASPDRDGRMVGAGELAESLDGSLRRLRTDYVDVLHLHGVAPDQYAHCREVLVPELRRQQELGKIRFLGITEKFIADPGHRMLSAALPDDLFDVVMTGFSLLNPSARGRVFPLTQANDVGTLIMFAVRRALSQPEALKAMARDLIDQGLVDPGQVDADDPLGFLRQRADVGSVVECAYRFCRHEPGAQVVLTGTGDAAHLEANIRSILAPPLPTDVSATLKAMFGQIDSISGN